MLDYPLYLAAKALYRSSAVHDDSMKQAQRSLDENNAYRSKESRKVLAAARRFGLDLAGKTVLDMGCNDAALTVGYWEANPRRLLGVDVNDKALERARARDSRLEIHKGTAAIPDASIDVILSYDVFEHIADVRAVLAECRRILTLGGQMLIGTWGWGNKAAPHLWATMPVPWAHVFVSEKTLLKACRRVYLAPWYRPTFHDLGPEGQRLAHKYTETSISRNYLNHFSVADFERAFNESGLDVSVSLEPFGATPWMRPLMKVPILREYLHGYLWAVLTKR